MKKPFLIVYSVLLCCELYAGNCFAEPNLITFSNIDKAWKYSQGQNTKVAVLDWLFDMSPKASDKYVNPTSMVPGKPVGSKKPWHGEWMAEIVHQIAPEAKIIPIRARPGKDSLDEDGRQEYEKYLVKGIRFAADQGAVAVTNSMGPVTHCKELEDAIDYAEQKGTVFIDVHPERIVKGTQTRESNNRRDHRIIHTGVVSVPKYPTKPKARRDIYVWPYMTNPVYKDGWGYSNGPPIVAGVIALMKSVNPDLSPQQVRTIIAETAYIKDGFKVLDAEAAVRKVIGLKTNTHEPNEPNQPAYLKVIPPEKLKEDLDFLFKTIEEVHPNMYAYTSKEEFEPVKKQLYEKINNPINLLDFCKAVAPVVASLRNGHTFLQPPFEFFQNYAKAGGKYFPIEIQIDEESVILTECQGPYALPIGAEVLTFDDISAIEFLRKAARYMPSENKPYNLALIQRKRFFPIYLWLEKNNAELLDLQLKTTDGRIEQFQLKALGYEELVNYQKSSSNKIETASQNNNTPYTYRYIPDCNVGLIEFNSFNNRKSFRKFLRGTFKKICEQNINGLIIDIRKNPGGNSQLGDDLLKYLTDKPFLQFEKVDIKVSEQLIKGQPNIKQQFPKTEIGSIVSIEPELDSPGKKRLRFNGKIFVLIGPESASSSVSFASAVKHFGIGALVGQETIDTTVAYGDCIKGTLPNTGLVFSVAAKRFVDAGGKEDGRGVIPDYEVKQKPEDTAKGVDTVLQFTLDLIEKEQRKREIKEKQE
ncbi:MAG: S41 family peptidase [Planctomycetota bacterium]|jgi:C-terminal processing protease CtpA/Prc